jgi:hypothetical protein
MRFAPLRLIAWFTCALLVAGAPAAAWDASQCLDTTGPKAFRDRMADILTKTDEKLLMGLQRNTVWYKQDAYDTIRRCQKRLISSENVPFNSCMNRVTLYADVVSRSQGNLEERLNSPFSLGLDVDNQNYLKAYKKILEIPPCLNKPDQRKELFEALDATLLSDQASVDKTVNLIKKRCEGAVVVPYVSQTVTSIDGPDGSVPDKHGRIVVLIQDGDTNHYVQFTVDARDPVELRRQASVVKVSKTKGTFIFDWQRTDNHEFVYQSPGVSPFGNDQHCYTCHWSGVLAIHPFEVPTDDRPDVGGAALSLPSGYEEWLTPLNTKYASETAKLNLEVKKDTKDPVLRKVVGSPSLLAQLPNLFSSPSSACSPEQQDAMSKLGADTCNSGACHANRGKAIFELGNYGDMINKYIAGGLMPSNKAQSLTIRKSASECFQKDAAAKMTTWLKSEPCTQ